VFLRRETLEETYRNSLVIHPSETKLFQENVLMTKYEKTKRMAKVIGKCLVCQ